MGFLHCDDRVIGKPAIGSLVQLDLYAKDEIARMKTIFDPKAPSPLAFTFPIRHKDGTESWLAATSKQTRDAEGRIAETLFVGTDVTEAVQAKQMLEDLEVTHSAMLNGIGEGVVATDRTGIVIYTNGMADSILEGERGRIVGMSVLDVIAERDLPLAKRNLKTRQEGVAGRLEYWLKIVDGTEFQAQVIASPIMQNGQFRWIIYSISDITERRATEESLRASEERFRQVTENAEEWIWEVDKNGLYTFCSLLRDPDAVEGQSVRPPHRPQHRNRSVPLQGDTQRVGHIYTGEWHAREGASASRCSCPRGATEGPERTCPTTPRQDM